MGEISHSLLIDEEIHAINEGESVLSFFLESVLSRNNLSGYPILSGQL